MNYKEYFFEKDKKNRTILLSLCLGMIILCSLLALFKSQHFLLGDMAKLNNDDVRYLNTARVLLNEGKLIYYGSEPTTFIMPLYPLFLTGVMAIFGTGSIGLIAIQIFQALMQGISLYLVYFIGKSLFNKKVALYTAIISFLYLPEYSASNLILTEVFYKILFLLMFYFAIIALKENKLSAYIFTSILWALSCLVRPNSAPFPLFIIIFWIVYKYNIKDMLKYTLVAFIIFVSIFSPWWIRNYKVTGEFFLFTQSSASPKLIGTKAWGKLPSFAEDIPKELHHDKRVNGIYMSEDEQHALGSYIIKRGFKEEPLNYGSWYTLGKTLMLYVAPYYFKEVFGIHLVIAVLQHLALITLSILGIIAMCRKKNRTTNIAMLIVLFAINTIVCLPFVTFNRYGYPNMFMLILMAAYYIDKKRNNSSSYSNHILTYSTY